MEMRMRKFIVSTLALAAVASPVMAQSAQAVSPVPEDLAAPAARANQKGAQIKPQKEAGKSNQQPQPSQADQPVTAQSVEDGLRTRLAHAGFTDIEMLPTSFLVRAKDANGNPVMLVLSPGSAAEFMQGGTPEDQDDGAPTGAPVDQQKF
jgi:hypothetical protein